MTSKRRPGASQNGSGDRTLSKNARSRQLRSYSFFSLPEKRENQKKTMILGTPVFARSATFFVLFRSFFRNCVATVSRTVSGDPRDPLGTPAGLSGQYFLNDFGLFFLEFFRYFFCFSRLFSKCLKNFWYSV